MASAPTAADTRGNYTGLIVALAIIGVVVLVFAGLWIHYHG